MLNNPHTYFSCGSMVAKARNERDEARAKFHRDWFNRALALETDADKPEARFMYDTGYKATRTV